MPGNRRSPALRAPGVNGSAGTVASGGPGGVPGGGPGGMPCGGPGGTRTTNVIVRRATRQLGRAPRLRRTHALRWTRRPGTTGKVDGSWSVARKRRALRRRMRKLETAPTA